jgi:hypothetical protein
VRADDSGEEQDTPAWKLVGVVALYGLAAGAFGAGASWTHGVIQGLLVVLAVVLGAASLLSGFIFGAIGWAFVAVRHRIIGAVLFGTAMGMAIGFAWWLAQGGKTVPIFAGVTAGLAGFLGIAGRRTSRRQEGHEPPGPRRRDGERMRRRSQATQRRHHK